MIDRYRQTERQREVERNNVMSTLIAKVRIIALFSSLTGKRKDNDTEENGKRSKRTSVGY